jgi:hypothetical protein
MNFIDVDDKFLNLKIKRYLTQYDYLELELEETEYLFNKYNKQFLKEYYNIEEEEKPKIHIPDINEILEESLEESVSIDEIDKEISEEEIQIKKLYRLLSLKTHPDKNNNSIESKEIFAEINLAYKNKNILKLFKYAIQYNVQIPSSILNTCISLFDKTIIEIQSKIEHFKKTIAWNWGTSSEEDKEIQREHLKKANL